MIVKIIYFVGLLVVLAIAFGMADIAKVMTGG